MTTATLTADETTLTTELFACCDCGAVCGIDDHSFAREDRCHDCQGVLDDATEARAELRDLSDRIGAGDDLDALLKAVKALKRIAA